MSPTTTTRTGCSSTGSGRCSVSFAPPDIRRTSPGTGGAVRTCGWACAPAPRPSTTSSCRPPDASSAGGWRRGRPPPPPPPATSPTPTPPPPHPVALLDQPRRLARLEADDGPLLPWYPNNSIHVAPYEARRDVLGSA